MSNNKYYFPLHLDGGNRGCEGIAKGTSVILDVNRTQLIGLCTNTSLDQRLGIDKYVSLYPSYGLSFLDRIKRRIFSFLNHDIDKRILYDYHLQYDSFLDCIKGNDMMLSTGGDMLCYVNNQVNYTNNKLHERGVKTILWGCSMGPENLTPEKENTLRNFSLVYARESLSFRFFKELGLKNVVCYPDPAFVLKSESVTLPDIFDHGYVIGVNLSNYTVGDYNLNTEFGQEVRILLDYIFKQTSYQVLLIPHVLWADQDDRIIARNVAEEYSTFSDRLSILDSEKLNYQQIRFVISKCHAFIGGRTHAVISAYSTAVPTIALGYSIKSKGIAKDLDLSDEYVVDSKNIKKKGVLLGAFMSLDNDYMKIKEHLHSFIPQYIARTKEIKTLIEKEI